jgi:putative transposase
MEKHMKNPSPEYTISPSTLNMLVEQGPDAILELFRIMMNEAMKVERTGYLKAQPYERSEERQDYANGFKGRSITTGLGKVDLSIPQTRESGFYPKSLEAGTRSEKALRLALAEMYVQGVSTRKVSKIIEKLCGLEITSSQVSKASLCLDEAVQAFRERKLGAMQVVWLDAQYQKIRKDGHVCDRAILVAVGLNEKGQREILGVDTASSEAEANWRQFLEALASRGLTGVKLIISDDHAGLRKARQAIFPAIPWQRCIFHMAQNAQNKVPRNDMRKEIADAMRRIYGQETIEQARAVAKKTVENYRKKASDFSTWLETNYEDGLAFYAFKQESWRKIRTSNCLERLNKEIRRRTRVVGIFPNDASCIRLVGALLMEQNDEWTDGKVFLNPKAMERPKT